MRLEHVVDLMIAVFLFVLSVFEVVSNPIKTQSWFASRTIGRVASNLLPAPAYRGVNAANLSVGFAGLLFWLIGLRAENEQEFTTMIHSANPA